MLSDMMINCRRRLPVIVAPMFLVSGPELVIASCKAGLTGSFPTQNTRTLEDLRQWLDTIRDQLSIHRKSGLEHGGWGVSMIVHPTYERFPQELDLLAEYKPDLVMTALGSPKRVLETVHGYGGLVYADVMSIEHARKAADAGADGLVLVCGGAGGHTGDYNPFAFVGEVRHFFKGAIILGGAISDGRGIRAAQVMGADAIYMGTRFIACLESQVNDDYRGMMLRAGIDGVINTRAVTGVACSWLKESLVASGFDQARIAAQGKIDFSDVHGGHKPWKNIYAAGQGVGFVDRVATVQEVADQLYGEYCAAIEEEALFATAFALAKH
jgi:nitronate monooxygenase